MAEMRKWPPKYIWYTEARNIRSFSLISSVTGRGGHEFVVFTAMKTNAGSYQVFGESAAFIFSVRSIGRQPSNIRGAESFLRS